MFPIFYITQRTTHAQKKGKTYTINDIHRHMTYDIQQFSHYKFWKFGQK